MSGGLGGWLVNSGISAYHPVRDSHSVQLLDAKLLKVFQQWESNPDC
tara:strand:+ start:5497 stop:5637 length:141 start_codon:yes stop_codon:yes gene_type:complete